MKSYMTQRLDEYRVGNEDKGRLLVSCPISRVSSLQFPRFYLNTVPIL